MEKLKKNLLRLQALDYALSKQFGQYSNMNRDDWKKLLHKAAEIVQLKTSIRTEFTKSSTFVFNGDNSNSKTVLENIRNGNDFFC